MNDKEYNYVFNVWEGSEMKTIKDYHDLFLKCDVLLLVNVFEEFRNNSLKNYGLCPSHYLSTLGLSWNAMLKMTKIELELIPDIKVQEVEFLIFLIDTAKPAIFKILSKHIIYLDANNLYGYAMSTFFPTSGFKWIDFKEFDLDKYTRNSSKGCIP